MHLDKQTEHNTRASHRNGKQGENFALCEGAVNREAVLTAHDTELRGTIARMIRAHGREVVRERMEELLCRSITTRMLNSWTAPSRDAAKFPALYVDAISRATEDDGLRRLMLGPELCEMLELGEAVSEAIEEATWKQFLSRHRRKSRGKRKRS